jgi:hypothetical protein
MVPVLLSCLLGGMVVAALVRLARLWWVDR